MTSATSIRSAVLALIALGAASGVALAADPPAQEKCYGVAKAGQNDCADDAGTHSCAGLSKADRSPGDWKLVAAGTCAKLGGTSAPPPRKS